MNIAKIFNSRAKVFTAVAKDAAEYFKQMESVVRSYNNDDYNNFNTAVTWLTKQANTISAIKDTNDILYYLKSYDVFLEAIKKMNFIVYILSNDFYNSSIYYDKSATCSFEIDMCRNKIFDAVNDYKKNYQTDNAFIFKKLVEGVDFQKESDNIKKLIIDNHFTNDLAIYLSRFIINYVNIRPTVEKFKNDALGVDNNYVDQLLAYRHGLFPISDSMSLDNMMKYLKLDYNPKKSFEQFNKLEKGIVIIRKITDNPIRYNILPLISEHYIQKNNLIVNPNSGLNSRIVRKYNTIYSLDKQPTERKEQFNIESYINNKGINYSECFCLETFNDEQYHLLSNTFDSPVIKNVDNLGKVSKRPATYNKIMSDKIFSKVIPAYSSQLKDFDNEKTQWFDPSTFKTLIGKDLIDKFEEQFALVKASDWADIIYDKSIYSYVIGKRLYKELLPASKGIEFIITYIKNVDDIISKFNAAMYSEINKIKIPDNYFDIKSEAEMRKYITAEYTQAVDKAIGDLDASLWIDVSASLKLFIMKKLLIKI